LQTLEIELCRLGLLEIYQHIAYKYKEEKKKDLRGTMIKILIRCKIMEDSYRKMQLIFKIINRRQELKKKIEDHKEIE
jgi:hypothetical protein